MTEVQEASSPRQMFSIAALVLAIVFAGLMAYIVFAMGNESEELVPEVKAGVIARVVIEGPGTGDKPYFSRPLGAAIDDQGRIYVADTGNDRVCVFDSEGNFLFEFGGRGVAKPAPGIMATWEPGRMNSPAGIDVDENGDIYVADFRNDQIQVFDSEGNFLRRFPDPLEKVGRGASGYGGTGIAVIGIDVVDGHVYATDSYQVVVFTTEGEFVRQFGRPGTAPGEMDRPNGLAVAADGTIYLADSNNNRVSALAHDGTSRWVAGTPVFDLDEQIDNEFGLPRDTAISADNTILVIDAFRFEIVELDRSGNVLNRFGERGTEPGGFNFPNAIDVHEDRVLVTDKGNNRVQLVEIVGP
ncbi:MAG: 6-bladed beta-propeller [Actinobacteria bacterium]|nr:6-bladed beta-propeller [Actinomycetota bacterium]